MNKNRESWRGRAQRLPRKSKQRHLLRLLLPSRYTLFMTNELTNVTRAPLVFRVRTEKTGRGGRPFTWRHASATCGNVFSMRAPASASCGNMFSPCAAAREPGHTPSLLLEPPASTSSCDNMFSRCAVVQSRAADSMTHRGPLLEPCFLSHLVPPAFPSSGNMFSSCAAAMEASRATA